MVKPNSKPGPFSPTVSSTAFEKRLIIGLLALIQFVCPLLFFTNLTRNPYFTQISLIYIFIALIGLLWAVECWRSGEIPLPILGFEKSLGPFLGIALFSTVLSWILHPLLRPGIFFEGLRVWIFTLVNSAMAFYLPVLFTRPMAAAAEKSSGDEPKPLSIWPDIFFCLVWSCLWYNFSSMKSPNSPEPIWDPYGALVWGLGLVYALVRTRRGEARSFFHVIFSVAILSGVYSLWQYAGHDVIWSSPVAPYGGRPVSSFGNPNFLSSYLLLVCPLVMAFAFSSKGMQAVGYWLVSALCAVSVLCTLTRSTYVGLLAALLFFGILVYKKEHKPLLLKIGLASLVVVILVFIFPVTPVTKVQSPLARFTEIFQAMKTGESYGPWHQRILIWSSAWDMVKEKPWFGKGWGCFELFYPFYQGAYLFNEVFAQWRTHANNAHNVLMELWSQLGTVGVGLGLLFFVNLFASAWVIIKKKMEGRIQLIGAALLAGWLGMIVDNFFGNVSIFFAMPAFLFWWYLGALFNEAAAIKIVRRSARSQAGLLSLIGVAVFCLFVLVYYSSRWEQEAHYFEGFKFAKGDRIPESIKALEEAHAWFPGEVNTDYELGNSYARNGKLLSDSHVPDEAKSYIRKSVWAYQEALKANPGYDEIYYNLGVTEIQNGDENGGLRDLRMSILINPLLQNAYGVLSTHYVNTKQWKEASAVLEQGVRAFPRNREFWNNLAYIDSQLNEDQKSFEASKRAVQLDPTYKTSWQNFQSIAAKLKISDPLMNLPPLMTKLNELVNQKRFAEAKPIAKRTVELLPDNLDVGLSYANILVYNGETDASIAEFKRLIKIDPNFAAAHLNLGRVYQLKKENEQARLHYQKALEINSNDNEAKQALASLPAS